MNAPAVIFLIIYLILLTVAIERVSRNEHETRKAATITAQTTLDELKELREQVSELEKRLQRK
jgi:hypothetical protein